MRSISSIVSAAIITGPITSSSQPITAAAQAKSGIRRQAIPGARIRFSVTTRLIAKQTNPSVASAVPAIQASVPWNGVKTASESGGSAIVPLSGAV